MVTSRLGQTNDINHQFIMCLSSVPARMTTKKMTRQLPAETMGTTRGGYLESQFLLCWKDSERQIMETNQGYTCNT